MQTNDFCWIELLEIELFDYFTVCKQKIDVLLNYWWYIAMFATI